MTLRPAALLALLAAAACDPSAAAPGEAGVALRAFDAEFEVPELAPVADLSSLALYGDFGGGRIVWAVVDHPPDPGEEVHPPDPGEEVHPPNPGLEACVAGFGYDAVFTATRPGTYVVRALVLDPDSLALRFWVDNEVYVEGEDLSAEVRPADVMAEVIAEFGIGEVSGIDPTPFIDWEQVAGIEPTPFHEEEEVSGIDPTPFHGALLYPELEASLSAGCLAGDAAEG